MEGKNIIGFNMYLKDIEDKISNLSVKKLKYLHALKAHGANRICVIGNDDIDLSFAAASNGMQVTVVNYDPAFDKYNLLNSKHSITYIPFDHLTKKFDAVICNIPLGNLKDRTLKLVNAGGLLCINSSLESDRFEAFQEGIFRKRKTRDIPVIFFVNHKAHQCGVYQYGKRIADILKNSKNCYFHYVESDSAQEFANQYNNFKPNGIIYNFHYLTMKWLDTNLREQIKNHEVFQVSIFHDHVLAGFDYYIPVDPNFEESKISFQSPRPLFEYENKFPLSQIPIINCFGFGFGNKGQIKLAQLVNYEFDEAILNFHIPASHFCDAQGMQAQAIANLCQRAITKKGIQLHLSHRFMPENELLDFLAKGSLNAFLYDELNLGGCASTIDYALSVKRPIAITKSHMFRHIRDAKPSICVEDRSLKEIMASGFTPLEPFYEKWKPSNLIRSYENIVKKLV